MTTQTLTSLRNHREMAKVNDVCVVASAVKYFAHDQDIGKKTDDPDNEEVRGGKRVAPKGSFTFTPVAKRTRRTKGMAIGKSIVQCSGSEPASELYGICGTLGWSSTSMLMPYLPLCLVQTLTKEINKLLTRC